MKSYLELIPISAKVHKKQNRMTLLCIIFAVFLVTAVFSTAEMGVRMETNRLSEKHGQISLLEMAQNPMAQKLFLAAGVLFVMILIAGVLMIASSINSNVAQRTKFFGMMRCIGMSKRQIKKFVRLEALNWCKVAVPIGLALGVVSTWGICAGLHFVVGEEFADIPIFGVSLVGIVSGIVVGIVTVLLAASSPAKKASKTSPVMAVSGNSEAANATSKATGTKFIKIEKALGINHALSAKKNLFLMTGSFALSIILFLSFSVMIDFVGFLMPQSSSASDINISPKAENQLVDENLAKKLEKMPGVKEVYGRRSALDIEANSLSGEAKIDLISFDDFELRALRKDKLIKRGSEIEDVIKNPEKVLATWDNESKVKMGDRIEFPEGSLKSVEIAGLLKYDPFTDDGLTHGKVTLITSSKTFEKLTGQKDYSILMVQTDSNLTETEMAAIRDAVGENYEFVDARDQKTTGTYVAFVLCVYAFLLIIAMVSVLNIINSISMSVSSRIKQYGAMMAVGMDEKQLSSMIIAESFTYAVLGCVVGCVVGIILSKGLYEILITSHFASATWTLPVKSLAIILAVVICAALVAARGPVKRIKRLSITETINQL